MILSAAVETGCDELTCAIDLRVAVVTLARPEARNALTLEMKRPLAALLPRLAEDRGVRQGAGAPLKLRGFIGEPCFGASGKKTLKMTRNSEKNKGLDFLLTKGLRAYKFV